MPGTGRQHAIPRLIPAPVAGQSRHMWGFDYINFFQIKLVMRYLIVLILLYFAKTTSAQEQREIERQFYDVVRKYINIDSINKSNEQRVYFVKPPVSVYMIEFYSDILYDVKFGKDSFNYIITPDTFQFHNQKMYSVFQRDSIRYDRVKLDSIIEDRFQKYMLPKGVKNAFSGNPKYYKEFDTFLAKKENKDIRAVIYLRPAFIYIYPVISMDNKIICYAFYEKAADKWGYGMAAVFKYENNQLVLVKSYQK